MNGLQHLARVQDAQRVERRLDRAHAGPRPRPAAARATPAARRRCRARAVTVPPRSSAARKISSRTASVSSSASGSSRSKTGSGGGCRRRHGRRSPHRTSCARAIRSIAASSSGTRLRGTPTSSMRTVPCRSSARSARRRAWRSQSASCASAARTTSVAPARSRCGTSPGRARGRGGAGQVGLDEQHRRRVAVEAEVMRVVDGEDRTWSSSSSVTGMIAARPSSPATASPAALERREEREQRRARGRQRAAAGASPR